MSNRTRRTEDRAVWAQATREVTPLPGRGAPGIAPTPEMPRSVESPPPARTEISVEPFAGIDRANHERLKRGRHPIEARLDLHGRTQAEAHRALVDFVETSHERGCRCVLVITGRGLGPEGPGVLKRAVPRWLMEAEMRRRVLAVAAAQPRHGGAGAIYLLLRRRR